MQPSAPIALLRTYVMFSPTQNLQWLCNAYRNKSKLLHLALKVLFIRFHCYLSNLRLGSTDFQILKPPSFLNLLFHISWPIYQKTPLTLTSKYIPNPIMSQHHHCHHPGLVCLDHWHSCLTGPASFALTFLKNLPNTATKTLL